MIPASSGPLPFLENNTVEVRIVEGDLLNQETEAIVNAWNRNIIPWWLLLPQGVSGAIKRRAGLEPFRDGHDLADRLAGTKNHLLMPLGDGPEVIDRCERQPLEVHAAMSSADPAR